MKEKIETSVNPDFEVFDFDTTGINADNWLEMKIDYLNRIKKNTHRGLEFGARKHDVFIFANGVTSVAGWFMEQVHNKVFHLGYQVNASLLRTPLIVITGRGALRLHEEYCAQNPKYKRTERINEITGEIFDEKILSDKLALMSIPGFDAADVDFHLDTAGKANYDNFRSRYNVEHRSLRHRVELSLKNPGLPVVGNMDWLPTEMEHLHHTYTQQTGFDPVRNPNNFSEWVRDDTEKSISDVSYTLMQDIQVYKKKNRNTMGKLSTSGVIDRKKFILIPLVFSGYSGDVFYNELEQWGVVV
jgi:hypothetical protein